MHGSRTRAPKALTPTTPADLYTTLGERAMPMTVAQLALRTGLIDDAAVRQALTMAAKGRGYVSELPDGFAKPVPLDRHVADLVDALRRGTASGEDGGLGTESSALRPPPSALSPGAVLAAARNLLGAGRDESLQRHRFSRAERATRPCVLRAHHFNRVWRLGARLERELGDYERQRLLYGLGQFAKTIWAAKIPFDLFAQDLRSAIFVAYYTANLGRRSWFTAGPQLRALDEVAAVLLKWALAGTPNYTLIAYVFPRVDILARMDAKVRVELLSETMSVMHTTAGLMAETARASGMDLARMVVQQGDDSSTWNALAGAWNKARDYWIALITALGQADLFI